MNKLKALLQWFMELELHDHKHWCNFDPGKGCDTSICEHQSVCWHCTGLFCSNLERKDCPKCVSRRSK